MKTLRKITVLFTLAAVAIGGSGCATKAQRARGMDNSDARREAVWTGVFVALGTMIFGPDEEDSSDTQPDNPTP
jgi:uncharacterized membrane protein YedE/YeeE